MYFRKEILPETKVFKNLSTIILIKRKSPVLLEIVDKPESIRKPENCDINLITFFSEKLH